MQDSSKIHVGLDVHKDGISIAAAEPGRVPGRLIGKVTHDVSKLFKVLAKVGNADELHIVYEAGPTSFGLQLCSAQQGLLVRDHRPLADTAPPGRPDQDRRARLRSTGRMLSRWPVDCRVDPRPRGRSDTRPVTGTRRRGQQSRAGPPPTQGILAASRRAIHRQDLMVWGLLPLAGHAELWGGGRTDSVHRILASRDGCR